MNWIEWSRQNRIPQYYITAIAQLLERMPLAGKRVLEVGGSSLPHRLTNELLGAAQWVSVDFVGWGGGYQQKRSGEEAILNRHFYPADALDEIDWGHEAILIDGDANAVLPQLQKHFDVVISVNCFEHVAALAQLVGHIYDVLKPGGALFSVFGPIWSCAVGHHMSINRKLHFNSNENLLRAHEHLLWTADEIRAYLRHSGIDEEAIEMALYKLYDKTDINRLFYRDYIKLFSASGFQKKSIWSHHRHNVEPDVAAQLNALEPDDYETYSIGVYLEK